MAALVAVLIVVLLGVAALVLDLGLAMDTRGRRRTPRIVALAAAVALAEGESTLVAVSRAESFASRNRELPPRSGPRAPTTTLCLSIL